MQRVHSSVILSLMAKHLHHLAVWEEWMNELTLFHEGNGLD